jgi:hypothetical protein
MILSIIVVIVALALGLGLGLHFGLKEVTISRDENRQNQSHC